MKVNENNLFKITALIVALVVAWAIPVSLFFLIDNKDLFGDNVAAGAEANGVTNLTQKTGEAIEGLPSTTLSFTANQSTFTEPSTAVNFVANSVSSNRNLEIANLDSTGSTLDGKTFSLQFFAASKADYLDGGSFNVTTQILSRMLNSKVASVDIVSKPTNEGKRTIEVTAIAPEGSDRSGTSLKRAWQDTMGTIKNVYTFQGDLVKVTVKSSKDSTSSISGEFYDDATYEQMLNVPEEIWGIVNSPSTSAYSTLPIKSVTYDGEFVAKNSALKIVLDETQVPENPEDVKQKFVNIVQKNYGTANYNVNLFSGDLTNILSFVYAK